MEATLPRFSFSPMKDDATLDAEDDATSRSSSSIHTKGLDSSFDPYSIHLLASGSLAVMGIDKCTSRYLILCPHLFERCFDETSPVLTDLRHLTLMSDSFTAIASRDSTLPPMPGRVNHI